MNRIAASSAVLTAAMAAALFAGTPAQAQSAVPTTKILAVSHSTGKNVTPQQRAAIMQHEVRDTVNAYLGGKIDQWYVQTDGKGVVFIVNAATVEEAKAVLEKFPLGQAGLMDFDYVPLGPLSPLKILSGTPIPAQ